MEASKKTNRRFWAFCLFHIIIQAQFYDALYKEYNERVIKCILQRALKFNYTEILF